MTLCHPETNENKDMHKVKHVFLNLFLPEVLAFFYIF